MEIKTSGENSPLPVAERGAKGSLSDEEARFLERLLADEHALSALAWVLDQTTTPQEPGLRRFLEWENEMLSGAVREIENRAGLPEGEGTVDHVLNFSSRGDALGANSTTRQKLGALLKGHQAVVRKLRREDAAWGRAGRDAPMGSFLSELRDKHEKIASMIEAYLRSLSPN